MTPPRRFSGTRLVVASHNQGKVREIRALLAPFGIETLSSGELDLDEPEETGTSFAANARLKAQATARASGLPALADDSGLCVAALGGEPGIHSARWAGSDKNFAHAMERVEQALARQAAAGNSSRAAWFVCALCLAWPDGHDELFEGRIDGTLVWPPRGSHGFGYDPIFVPEGHDETFGEMEPGAKHAMSHRARAFARLVDACFAKE